MMQVRFSSTSSGFGFYPKFTGSDSGHSSNKLRPTWMPCIYEKELESNPLLASKRDRKTGRISLGIGATLLSAALFLGGNSFTPKIAGAVSGLLFSSHGLAAFRQAKERDHLKLTKNA